MSENKNASTKTKGFTVCSGLVLPLDSPNVDTDQIIPKQFLQKITKTGFGQHLFHNWRYLDAEGKKPNPDFILNEERYQGASILLARENFGSGSSREHAPWALMDYGFKVVIATSFADIFYNNSLNNGMLLVKLAPAEIQQLFDLLLEGKEREITVDLLQQTVVCGKVSYAFSLNATARQNLLDGNDMIDQTLLHEADIASYENERNARAW